MSYKNDFENIKNDYTIQDLENVLDNIPYEIWIKGEDDKYKFVNKAFSQRINLSKEKIIGKNNLDFEITKMFNKDDNSIVDKKNSILREDKVNIAGKETWFEIYKTPLETHGEKSKWIMAFSREITSYKEMKKILKDEIEKSVEAEEELELFLETATDLCGILPLNGSPKKLTSKWTNILGWSNDELLKMNFKNLVHPEDINILNKIINSLYFKNKDCGVLIRFLCKSGDYKLIEWSWNYVAKFNSVILTGKDVTEHHKLEEEKKLLEDAVALETLKTEFFANISHEFRTPINIILTTTQLISSNLSDFDCSNKKDKLIHYVKGLKQNSYRLLKLVNNLLDITKIKDGYYELKLINTNIINLIEEIVLSVAEHIGNKGRNLIFDTNEEELIMACDPDRIETIMLNLLSNAVKYTEKNGEIKVTLTVKKELNLLLVSVKDNGITIDEKYSKLIFDRFTQADSLLSRKCEGSGIGLYLVKSLVELHSGKIWANTTIKQGAEILFTLPIKQVENQSQDFQTKILDAKIERFNVEFSDIYVI